MFSLCFPTQDGFSIDILEYTDQDSYNARSLHVSHESCARIFFSASWSSPAKFLNSWRDDPLRGGTPYGEKFSKQGLFRIHSSGTLITAYKLVAVTRPSYPASICFMPNLAEASNKGMSISWSHLDLNVTLAMLKPRVSQSGYL